MAKLLKLQRDLAHIAVALNLFSAATGLVGVFIPLVILRSGGALWQVSLFYLVYAVTKLTLNYPAMLTIQRRGAHVGLGAAFTAGALQMVAILVFAGSRSWTALLAGAVALALTNAFLWNSMHLFISSAMREAEKSSSIATIAIIGQLSGVATPLIGGAVGAYLGTQWLLALALIVCVAAFIPLRGMAQVDIEMDTSTIYYDFRGAPARDVLANFCFNIETAVGVMVWPIYLAVVIASFQGIGAISGIAAAVTVVVTWIAGRRGDQGRDRAVLREGVAVSSAVDIARIFASSQLWVTLVSSAYKASLAYFGNAWSSLYYSQAKRRGLQYIMSMEIACDLAYVALWGVLLIVLKLSSPSAYFTSAFLLAAVAAWGCLAISNQGELPASQS